MDGNNALEIARKTIDLWVKKNKRYEPETYPQEFNENRGVFVTIETHPKGQLRGCIGFAEPIYPFIKALQEASISASTQDPRFPPIGKDELDKITVEVSILTKPELIKIRVPEDYVKAVKIGEDGLIVRYGYRSGLLLPQVATDYKWDSREFLEQACMKAGLEPDTWLNKDVEVLKFQSHIFSEKEPGRI